MCKDWSQRLAIGGTFFFTTLSHILMVNMKSKITRVQEIDDQIKKLLKDADDKVIDKETSAQRIAKLRQELKMLIIEIRTKK